LPSAAVVLSGLFVSLIHASGFPNKKGGRNMKRNVIIAAVSLFILAHSSTVFSESASSGVTPDVGLLMLQQQLQSMQKAYVNPDATENVELATIVDTWTGIAPTMEPTGNCVNRTVEVKIEKICGKLVKGYVKALGVTVPVTGEFASNVLYLLGTTTVATNTWIASIMATYTLSTDKFTVQIFNFQKVNPVPNNVYDTSWKLNRI
jgi:hypothetical protein